MQARIKKQLDCNVLAVTSAHIILCHEKRIQSFLFDGTKERFVIVA
jgi:intraflagellar transport protein 122